MIEFSYFYLLFVLLFVSRFLCSSVSFWMFCKPTSVESPLKQVTGRIAWRFLTFLVFVFSALSLGAILANSNFVPQESLASPNEQFSFVSLGFILFAFSAFAFYVPKMIVRAIAKGAFNLSFVDLETKTFERVDPISSEIPAFFAFMTVAFAIAMRWELSTTTDFYQMAAMIILVIIYMLFCAGVEGYFYTREYLYGCAQSAANMAISHVASFGFLVFAFVHIVDVLQLWVQSGMAEAMIQDLKHH